MNIRSKYFLGEESYLYEFIAKLSGAFYKEGTDVGVHKFVDGNI